MMIMMMIIIVMTTTMIVILMITTTSGMEIETFLNFLVHIAMVKTSPNSLLLPDWTIGLMLLNHSPKSVSDVSEMMMTTKNSAKSLCLFC
jgi:hypothetical protein